MEKSVICRLLGKIVTSVLKKAVSTIRKSCDNYHEKAVPAVRKNYDSYHEKVVTAIRKSCLLWAEPMRSDGCFQTAGKVISTFTLWIWLKMVRSL